MIQNSKEQSEAAHGTAACFQEINTSAESVYDESSRLRQLVEELTHANRAIVEGIETISAATEEVTAHSNETFESSAENSEITNEVGHIIEELNQMAHELVNQNA
jgi:methyl-accepting chemotaxis protein